ncbi:MAG TPA: serine acetyltransferase [Paludibacter sp.]
MIHSKSDYVAYLKADRQALGIGKQNLLKILKEVLFPNYIWRFQRILRKFEYYKNCKQNGIINQFLGAIVYYRFLKLSVKLGFSIPANVFGPGLSIPHYGTIIVNAQASVGANCRLHACTNIGASGGSSKAPVLGNNVYIAPGAKIFGEIIIPSNTAIGANSVVNKSFLLENTLIGGIPAKVIKEINIKTLIKHI